MHFGPDGYLYVSLGDEGRQNDQFNNSQKIASDFFSGLLRIDVDKKEGSLEPNPHASVPTDNGIARYSVPADNPYVGITTFNGSAVTPSAVRTEFWAAGMRNPWRFSFDGNELWLAESLEETGLLYGEAANNGGNSANKLVVPGDVPHSIVYNRVAVANGFTPHAAVRNVGTGSGEHRFAR